MEVKEGYGYLGVLMYDDVNDKVQCHICGKWFVNVGGHTSKKHKIPADDYKIRFGLTLRTALCSIGLSNKRRETTQDCIEKGLIRQDIMTQGAKYNRQKNRRYRQSGVKTHQYYNRAGLCELQIKTRYEIVKKIVGDEPTQNQILQYDRKLFGCGIVPRYGNLNNFKKHIGVEPNPQLPPNTIPTLDLVAELRKAAHLLKRAPRVTDFMPKHKPYYRAFGSWSNALRTAGIK